MELESDTRFKALIQPIRDLSLNWDIDIAEELGDYLEELDNLQITLDSGRSNLNFAEAALLIQGSAAVYSKKVEYLHQLVLHALELITFQKSTKAANAMTGTGPGASNQPIQKGAKAVNMSFLEDERILFGSDPEYLLLDDVLDEANNIALNIPKNSTKDPKLIRRHSLSGDLSKSSMILMHTILHVDNGSTSLRLATCRMDANGALLIGVDPVANTSQVVLNDPEISMIAKNNSSMYTVDSRVEFDEEHGQPNSIGVPSNSVPDHYDDGHYDNDDHYNPSAYDDHDFGGGGESEPYHTATDGPAIDNPPVAAPTIANDTVRNSARTASRAKETHNIIPTPIRKTIPTPLDPHEATDGSKSCRKGHTYRIPACLSHRKSMASNCNKTTTVELFQRDPVAALLAGRIPLLGLACVEFQDLAKEIRRSVRSEQFRKRLAAQKQAFGDNDFLYKDPTELFEEPPIPEPANEYISEGHHEPEKYWEEEEDDYDDGGPMYWQTDDGDNMPMISDGDELGEHVAAVMESADIQALASFNKPKPLYVNPFSAVFENEEEEELARRVEDALNDSLSLGNTYESLCRRHIQEFMRGAEVYARETQLSRRVSDWTRRLEPVLRQQEESTAFDINIYADSLLTKVSETVSLPDGARTRRSMGSVGTAEGAVDEELDTQQVVGIEEIAAGMDAPEFSRMFLACLQLANSGNIEIVHPTQHHDIDSSSSAETATTPTNTNIDSNIPSSLFGIQILDLNRSFGLQMSFHHTDEDESTTHKQKSKLSKRSKSAPMSSLAKANSLQAVPTNE